MRSLCRGCIHEFEDKNYCRTLDSCPLKIDTIKQPSFEKRKTKPCPMEGCLNQIRIDSFVCNACNAKVSYRKRIGVPPTIIYRKNLPKFWKKKYGVFTWKKRKKSKE